MNALQYLRGRAVRYQDVENVLIAPTSEEPEVRIKRAKVEIEKDKDEVPWGFVLDEIKQTSFARYPFPSSAGAVDAPPPFCSSGVQPTAHSKYVHLMDRNKCDIYEERIKHLGGSKKLRFDKQMQLKGEVKDGDTAAFFSQARKQGSLF